MDKFIDITTFILSMIGIVLEIKQIRLFWILYIISSLMFIYEFINTHLYASTFLQIIYVILSIYGWIEWGKKHHNKEVIKIRYATNKERIIYLFSSLLIGIIIYIMSLKLEGTNSIIDSAITAICIVATFMSTYKQIDSFFIFTLSVFLSVPLYISNKLYFSAFAFLIFGILDFIGFIKWRNIYKSRLK